MSDDNEHIARVWMLYVALPHEDEKTGNNKLWHRLELISDMSKSTAYAGDLCDFGVVSAIQIVREPLNIRFTEHELELQRLLADALYGRRYKEETTLAVARLA